MRIFNRIRQKLLSDLKIKNYFLYALGEIVLIVVGILIALQINNWNAEKKNLRKEQKILASLKDNFSINQTKIDLALQEYEATYNTHLLRIANSGPAIKLPNDSIIDSINKIDFVKLDIVSGGNFPAISQEQSTTLNDQELKNELTQYSNIYTNYKHLESNIESLTFELRKSHQKYVAILSEDENEKLNPNNNKEYFDSDYLGWLRDRESQNKSVEIKWKIEFATAKLNQLKELNQQILNDLKKE